MTHLRRYAAIVFTLLALAVIVHAGVLVAGGQLKIDSDVLALLPPSDGDEIARRANEAIMTNASRDVVVLVGAKSFEVATDAARRFKEAFDVSVAELTIEVQDMSQVFNALRTSADGFLTDDGRSRLQTEDFESQISLAQSRLFQPVSGTSRSWLDDPIDLFGEWLRERTLSTKIRPRDGFMSISHSEREYVLLRLKLKTSGFNVQSQLSAAIAASSAAARSVSPEIEIKAAGVPLFAEAAAQQAASEVSTVGFGSLAAIVLLVWLSFRSFRPLVLVASSVLFGCIAGLSACALVFDQVHILTLVFGSSLVGVAEDYGIHYFATRQASPSESPVDVLRRLSPGLWLALLTSVGAYAALALVPFPGLRQMALFSAVGLTAAFGLVFFWYPFFDRGVVRHTDFARAWSNLRAKWPQLRGGSAMVAIALSAIFIPWGIWHTTFNDDVHALQSAPPALVSEHMEVAQILGLPSPAQFFIVEGDSTDDVLRKELALTKSLNPLIDRQIVNGFEAVSDWIKPQALQVENASVARATRDRILARLQAELDFEIPQTAPFLPLTVEALLRVPGAEPLGRLWLGQVGDRYASIVTLKGVTPASIAALMQLPRMIDGVRFVDRSAEISALLRSFRRLMSNLLAVGYALVIAILWRRFRWRSLRAVAPSALASLGFAACLGFVGQPLQLFHVLALWLILGMGVDYAIFLLEHPSRADGEAWFAVGVGAASTLLSFGLLGLSETPALHAFGFAMAVGIAVVWITAPWFCDEAFPKRSRL